MTGRQWQPGDVAAWQRDGRVEIIYRYLGGQDYSIPEWQTAHDGGGYPRKEDLRPLVVIDPEDVDVAQVLAHAYDSRAMGPSSGVDMQAALRSLIAPPKPEEPTGRYAVVVDADGTEWLRTRDGHWAWVAQEGFAAKIAWGEWSRIDAVKVLSEGVTE